VRRKADALASQYEHELATSVRRGASILDAAHSD
jgi:hypothetical protein